MTNEQRTKAIRACDRIKLYLQTQGPLALIEHNIFVLCQKVGLDPAKLKPMAYNDRQSIEMN